MLVASFGVLFWAGRSVWESQHPAYGAARGLQARSPAERLSAIQQLQQIGVSETGIAIPPLVAALLDPEAEVRAAACDALRLLLSEALRTGTSAEAVRAATTALIAAATDPLPDVRFAVAGSLGSVSAASGSTGTIDLEPTFAALTGMLRDRDPGVRRAVLYALGLTARKVSAEPPPRSPRA